MSFRQWVPWQVRIVAKIVFSRLPLKYGFWRANNLFKHGQMAKPEYAFKVFQRHFDRVKALQGRSGFTLLELGPGDSIASAIIGQAFGASKTYLVDSGRYATEALSGYRALAEFLSNVHLDAGIDLQEIDEFDDLLAETGAVYLTEGLKSLSHIESNSIDFVFSQAVLEHVKRDEFAETMRQLRRVVREDGCCSHRVDLKDHLGGGLNNLRFSDRLWETELMSGSGFYTNRIRYREMLKMMSEAGFHVEVVQEDRFEALPTRKRSMARQFRGLDHDELLVSGFDVVLTPL